MRSFLPFVACLIFLTLAIPMASAEDQTECRIGEGLPGAELQQCSHVATDQRDNCHNDAAPFWFSCEPVEASLHVNGFYVGTVGFYGFKTNGYWNPVNWNFQVCLESDYFTPICRNWPL